MENENKILNKPHNGKNSYHLIDDSVIIPDNLVYLETPRVNPVKEQVTLNQGLNGKLLSPSTEIDALKSFVLE